jgi:hypothetical protein
LMVEKPSPEVRSITFSPDEALFRPIILVGMNYLSEPTGESAMKRYLLLIALGLPMVAALPATAGPLFGKHNKSNPAERVPQLIVTLKTDKDDGHRAEAANELRDFDATKFPEMVPVLADIARSDPNVSVRAEAVQTLGKLRPVTREAGWAIEDATRDSAIRVRLQARTSLMSYRLSGFHSDKPPEAVANTPPAPASGSAPIAPVTAVPTATVRWNAGETAPPPLARPVTAIPTSTPPGLPRAPTPVVPQGPDLPPQ